MGLRFDLPASRRCVARPPRPEEVFLSWLMALPGAVDPALAADAEILRLNQYTGPHPGPARLLVLFEAFRDSLETPRHPRAQ